MDNLKFNNLKLKKQLSLVVFLPFLFVTPYNNSYDEVTLPIMFVTSATAENNRENKLALKIVERVKKLITNLINNFRKRLTKLENTKNFKQFIIKIVLRESSIVLNRGSPVLYNL